jgi:hypothetical protein
VVERIVRETLQRHSRYDGWRAGRNPALRSVGLEIGPQRYHDPSIWGPNYRLRDELAEGTDSAAKVAAVQPVPPTSDQRFLRIARGLAEADSKLAAGRPRPNPN